MADKRISELEKFTPITDGISIPCTVAVDGKNVTRKIVTDDFAKYVAPNVLNKLTAGRGITITDGEVNGTVEIACDLDTELYVVVTELPTTNINPNKIYLVPATSTTEGNIYIEYVYADSKWEKIGEHKADVSLNGYATESWVEEKIDEITGGDGELNLTNITSRLSTVETATGTNTTNIASLTDEVSSIKTGYAKTSDIPDITGLATKAELADYAKTSELNIPTKVSELTNDAGYLSAHQDISGKVDKVEGKGLSTEDFTTAEKTKLTTLENYDDTSIKARITALEAIDHSNYLTEHQDITGKVDKEEGKGLSTEDFTSEFKTKLMGIEAGAEKNKVTSVNGATGDITGLANASDIPTKVSELTNDAGYLSAHQDISGLATKAALEAATDLIDTLTAKVTALEAKLAHYDSRFGYTAPTEGQTDATWKKSFLVIEDLTEE